MDEGKLQSALSHVDFVPKEYATREEWLLDASFLIQEAIVKRCKDRDIRFTDYRSEVYNQPPRVMPMRVSVGFPAHVRPSSRGKPVAECWVPEMVADGIPAIFISPELGDSYDVLEHLTHEICHVMAIHEAGHKRGGDFSRLARAAGLEGPLTSTKADVELRDFFRYLIEHHIGEYERIHSPLLAGTHIPAKTSLLKAHCSQCGFTARVSKKWAKVIDHKCPYPPLKAPGGGGGAPMPMPEPEDEIDITHIEPPPSGGGEGSDDAADSKPDSPESAGDSSDADKESKKEDDAGDGKSDAGKGSGESDAKGDAGADDDVAECGACGAEVSATSENCSNCGAIFEDGDEGDEPAKEVTFIGGVKGEVTLDSIKHAKDMCPFETGCEFCEGSF